MMISVYKAFRGCA